MPKLSDPITIRGMEVKNRIGFPPMLTMSSDNNGRPTARTFKVHEQKVRGGVGMITYESTNLFPEGAGMGFANIGRDEDIPAYKKLTDMVHKYDVKFGIQISDGGMTGFFLLALFKLIIVPYGPSKVDLLSTISALDVMSPSMARKIKRRKIEIKELTTTEILNIEDRFAAGAKRAIDAGFDYVMIHAGHGLLQASFLSPWFNKRTDKYGGSLEKRCTFLLETIEKIREKIGDNPPITVRFGGDELVGNGNRIEDTKKIARILEKGGADCLDITQGIMYRSPIGIEIPTYYDHGCFIHLAEAIKKVVDIPVVGVGRIVDPRMADEFIQQGKADIINMGRQLICDADTPNKYFSGRHEDIRFCIGCLQECSRVCVQDAFSGQNYQELSTSTELKKIVIMGAGIAGMQAARVAKLRGHEVEIYEKSDKIGGLIPLVAAEYKKEDFMYSVDYLETQLKKLNVPIHLNKELTKEEINSLNPDILVLATGSEAAVPVNLKGKSNVITQDESILKNKPLGKNVVIWGLNVFWRGGVETAVSLTEEGYNVKALIGSNTLEASWPISIGRKFWILQYIRDKKISVYPKAKLIDVSENGVKFLDAKENEQFIEADTLVYCGSRIANGKALKARFEGVAPEIVLIGDCKSPGDIKAAISDAQTFARSLK